MRRATGFARVLFSLTAACLVTRSAHAQFEELVSKVPLPANSIVLINIEKMMSSPVAVKGKWRTEHSNSYAAGVTFLPPDAKTAVLASQYDFETMGPVWQVAAMELDHEASLSLVERLSGGAPDKIGEFGAVALPGDAYVVKFAPQVLAAMAPANRQLVGRWVRESAGSSGPHLSPYLTEAYQYANGLGTPIVLAMDFQDVATPETIRQMLEESGKYKDAAAIEQRVALFSTIRGITLGITLAGEQPFGKVKVDFGNDVSISPDEAKAMLLHALAKRGAMLVELEDWTAKVNGKQVTLEGHLTKSGMKRLSSLFDRPPAFQKDAIAADPSQQASANQIQSTAQASQEYFRRVTDLLEDLRQRPKQETGGRTIAQHAVWCDSYARKMDKLPILGVDPELVDYGAATADALRQASAAIKAIGARKRVRQVNTQPQYDHYTYGTTYGYSYRSNASGAGYVPYGTSSTVAVANQQAYSRELARVATEERVSGAANANQIFQVIQEATADMRRKMTAKYKVEFQGA